MGVRRTIGVAAAVAMGLALAACSSSSTKTYFETEGLRAPDQSCPVKPSRLGIAERLKKIDEG
ncbi:MAG: hypothetical protein EHM74_04870, partial [Hyphomicrobiales bacterium]